MQRYTSRVAALVAARSVLGSGRLVGMPASPALSSAVTFPAGSCGVASNSTCVAVIEEQQALWLALTCIVMRPHIRNDELKNMLGDAEKLSLLITTAMRTMNWEFDNKDLVKRQIEVAERDIDGVDLCDVAALKTFFAERYRGSQVEDTSIVWTLDDAISCGNEFVRVTEQPNEQWLRLLPAKSADDGSTTEITFRFDAKSVHVTKAHRTNPIRFYFENSEGLLTFNGVPVKSKRELVDILKTRTSRQGIAEGYFAQGSQLGAPDTQ
jgi:hypothetical protein